jgi:AcrR family transcriptional regulator
VTIAVVNMCRAMPGGGQRTPMRAYGGVSAVERVAQRRERLLAAALDLYGTRGFVATGVKDICRAAGVTDRYFYESFRDGSELFRAAFDRATGELLGLVAQRVADIAPEPEAQVRVAIEAFVRALADDPRKARLIFVEAPSAGPEVERHVRATLREFAALVAATARPHLPDRIPDRLVEMGALSLVGAIERVMIEWQDGQLDATIEEIVDFLVGLFLAAGESVGVGRVSSSRRRA